MFQLSLTFKCSTGKEVSKYSTHFNLFSIIEALTRILQTAFLRLFRRLQSLDCPWIYYSRNNFLSRSGKNLNELALKLDFDP